MFTKLKQLLTPKASVSMPITSSEAVAIEGSFLHSRRWVCSRPHPIPIGITISARENRAEGSSNFAKNYHGDCAVPHGDLNWEGLLENAGWKNNPVICPACQAGLSVEEFKQLRAEGKI